MTGPRFALLGLPRSGTTWAANWLTAGAAICLHDPVADTPPGDIPALDLGRPWGLSCSSLWLWEDVVRDLAARCPVVIVERDPAESNAELQAMGLPALPGWMHEVFARVPGLRVPFSDLWSEEGAARIWQHLRPAEEFDAARWRMLRDMRVTPILERVTICGGTLEALRAEYQRRGETP